MPGRRRYGFFRCDSCRSHWESAFVYDKGNNTGVYYEQQCKKCLKACAPYRTEPIRCSICHQVECICSREERDARHTDPSKPHRSDLCMKCKSGLRCQASFN